MGNDLIQLELSYKPYDTPRIQSVRLSDSSAFLLVNKNLGNTTLSGLNDCFSFTSVYGGVWIC